MEQTLCTIADQHSGDRHDKQPKHVKPYGLCLTVFLTPDSFLPSHELGSKKIEFNDVKIDVFFNGELCGSSFVAHRHHANGYQMTEHIVRFSGQRIGRLVEKPWVIVAPGQNADGTLREYHGGEEAYAGAESRWVAVSEALEAEATRVGCDESGAFSLLGEYLTTLANLAMPPEVEEMQKAGGPQFGVIDVVVIAGKGQKDDAKHRNLTEPTAIRLKASKPEVRKYRMNNSKFLLKRSKKNVVRSTTAQTDSLPLMSNNNERALATSSERLKASIESFGQQLQNSLGNSSRKESLSTVGKPTQIFSSKSDKQQDSSAFASRNNYSSFLFSSPSSVPNALGSNSPTEYHDTSGNPIKRSSSGHDEQHDSSATATKHNTLFPVSSSSDFKRTRRTVDMPSMLDVHVDKGQHLDQSPSIPASHIGPSALAPSDSKSITGFDIEQNCNEDPSPPPSTIVQRPKHRKHIPYEYVLDDKMTLCEEFDSVLAEAKQSQSVTTNVRKGENRTPVLRAARASRSGVIDRGARTLAGPSNVVDTNVKQPKLIIKLKIGGGLAPSAQLKTQPSASAWDSNPFGNSLQRLETPTTGSPLSSLRSTPTFVVTPSSPSTVVVPTARKLSPSCANSAYDSGSATTAWNTTWSPPPLSQDSVLTYAADEMVRSVKLERNGWFEEKDVVMGVRFLVG